MSSYLLGKRIILLFSLSLWLILTSTSLSNGANLLLPPPDQGDIKVQKPSLSPLEAADVKRYKRIFDLQDDGKWKKADRLIKQLDNKILLGHILYQRFMHPTAYTSRYRELSKWMLSYPDHPGAQRIYALAKMKNGGNARKLHKPLPTGAINFPADKPVFHNADEETPLRHDAEAASCRQRGEL